MTTPQSIRQLRYIDRKRKAGYCAYSGCQGKAPDAYYCPDHAKANAVRSNARYWAKVKADLSKLIEPVKQPDIDFTSGQN